MGRGLQVWDPAGQLILDVTERLTRLHSRGNYQAPSGSGNYPTVFVGVPGMANDGSWMVVASSGPGVGNPVSIGNGGFNVTCYDTTGGLRPINYYTVYRV